MASGYPARFLQALGRTTVRPEGGFLIGAGSLTLLAAFLTGRPALYAAASLLFALFAVGWLGTVAAGAAIETSWQSPDRVWAREPFPVVIRLQRRGWWAPSGIAIREPESGLPDPAAFVERLPRQGGLHVEVQARVLRRGHRAIPAPLVTTRWPFLVAECRAPAGPPRGVLAYPTRVAVPAAALRSSIPEAVPRRPVATQPRRGDLYRGIREWSPGDAPRTIAWRASARHGQLLVRELEREETGRIVVAFDPHPGELTPRDAASALERGCSKTASLIETWQRRGRRVSLLATGRDPVVHRSIHGPRALADALEALALLRAPRPGSPHLDPLDLIPAASLRGARIVLVVADRGAPSILRGRGGLQVLRIPSLRAEFRPRTGGDA